MKYEVHYTKCFDKDFDSCIKRNLDMPLLKKVMLMLQDGKKLPAKYKDHTLKGAYNGYRECHVQPDWLLVYKIHSSMIIFNRTGSHSDLF